MFTTRPPTIAPASAPTETRSYGKPQYEPREPEQPRRYNPAAVERFVPHEAAKPAEDAASAAPWADKPRRAKGKPEPKPKAKFKPKFQGNPKDKGKPKYKAKTEHAAGDVPRQRPAKS